MRTKEPLGNSFEQDADCLVAELNRHLVQLRRIHDLAVAYAEEHRENSAALEHLAVYVGEVFAIVSEYAARIRVTLDSVFDGVLIVVDDDEEHDA